MLNLFLKIFSKKVIWPIIIILIVGGITGTVYYYSQYNALKTNPNLEIEKETKELVATVSKLMDLPTDETPTVATVLDKDKLKDQPFFKNAENDDKLLAYPKAMKAILYRPSTNKIIEVMPIYINNQEQNGATGETGAQNNTPTINVAYYNGTSEAGVATAAEQSVKNAYDKYTTANVTNAANRNYTKTLVVDVSGDHSDEAKELADLLSGEVGEIPSGEEKPNADILIIVGK